jgi:hypothetical protein
VCSSDLLRAQVDVPAAGTLTLRVLDDFGGDGISLSLDRELARASKAVTKADSGTFVTVPLVFQDHSTEDTFGGIAAALKALLAATEEVFGRIEARAARERLRLANINARLARCRDKTALVAQSTRAVTMLAVPKFPACEVARHATFLALHDGIRHPAPGAELGGGGALAWRRVAPPAGDDSSGAAERRLATLAYKYVVAARFLQCELEVGAAPAEPTPLYLDAQAVLDGTNCERLAKASRWMAMRYAMLRWGIA